MIYRVVVDFRFHTENIEGIKLAVPWKYQDAQKMTGASYGFLADVMSDHGLRAPQITNPRARFYFTELGWRKVGRLVAAKARRLGHVIKVVRRKNPKPSQVIYRDDFQLAILSSSQKGAGLPA